MDLSGQPTTLTVNTTICFFINANAEDLRTFSVEHEGQKELEVFSVIADFGAMAVKMTDMIAKNVIDPELREWVMPSFTTTTHTDKVVGAILFMGAMQKYFSFTMTITCGLPSVTLLGELENWKEIQRRLEKINLLGEEPRQFASMLRPILQHMVLSFEDPTNEEVTHFWNIIVHRNAVRSGTDYLSGWLTAFCFWSEKGEAKHLARSSTRFGDVAFPFVDINEVPVDFASVPVKVNHYGHEYKAIMIAGSVGIGASSQSISSGTMSTSSTLNEQQISNEEVTTNASPGESVRDITQPMSGWWICQNEGEEEVAAREAEMKRLKDEIDREMKDSGDMYGNDERFENYLDMITRLEKLKAC